MSRTRIALAVLLVLVAFVATPAFAGSSLTISASAGPGGSISPSGNVQVQGGQDQTFTITPDACNDISDVRVDGNSVGAVASYTFKIVQENHTIDASFTFSSYTITPSAGAGGSISPSNAQIVDCGSSTTFSITANSCYSIADVKVDGSSVGAVSSYSFTDVQDNHTIDATFSAITYTITASAGTGGSISPSGGVSVDCNGTQAFTITPDGGYSIDDVLVDGGSVGAVSSYEFDTVDGNHTIDASFVANAYTIAASAGTGGSISPSGNVGVSGGGSQSFSIDPNTGHHVSDVVVDGSSRGAVSSYSFSNVTANHTIAASFAIDQFTINASAGTGGSISSPGSTTLNYGDNKTYTITANGGFTIADVVVDGTSRGAVSSYAFSNVAANHTIAASFQATSSTPSLSIADASTTEGNYGSKSLGFKVTLSAPSTQTVTVQYSTQGVTATTADHDYLGASSSLTFYPGTTSRTINITIYGDTKVETDETFQVNLASPVNATILDGQAIGTIVNDDGTSTTPPRISIDDVEKREGNYGTTPFVFTVSIDKVSSSTVTVQYQTADGSAKTSDNDYKATNGTATIGAGSLSTTITVLVNGDKKPEDDETFTVNLTAPSNASIGDGKGVGDIENDDNRNGNGRGDAVAGGRTELAVGPNPVRDDLGVRFSLATEQDVRLTVLDVEGRAIEELASGRFTAGPHEVTLSGRRPDMPAGLYFVRLVTADKTLVQHFARVQ